MDSKEFFIRFGRAIYNIDDYYSEFAKKLKVKSNTLWILYALNDNQVHTQKQICKDWGLKRSTINTIIKELELEGMITLEQIKGEKRELNIILTKKGKKYADFLLYDLYEIEKDVYSKIKTPELLIKQMEELLGLYKEKEKNL